MVEGVLIVHVSRLALHKTNWSNFNAKFLVCAANIHGGKVYDGQACHILCSVFKDGFAHISIPFLEFNGIKCNRLIVYAN